MTTTAATAARTTPTHPYQRGHRGPWCSKPGCGRTYYEHPLPAEPDTEIGAHRLADLTPDVDHHRHGHLEPLTLDNLVGYVVRRTIIDGQAASVDVAVFCDPGAYATALDVAWENRTRAADLTTKWAWAVVDRVYACGCRS